jgi:hypothetical protein
MRDGTPPHFSIAGRTPTDNKYQVLRADRGEPIAWLERPPDLFSPDTCAWDRAKAAIINMGSVNLQEQKKV